MANMDPVYVASTFASQYYTFLSKDPSSVYKFYQDVSVVTWPGQGGPVTTLQRIKDMIDAKHYKGCQVECLTVDAQASQTGGIIVVVTGTRRDTESAKNFSQTFFLAPQDKGYYVLNDILNDIDEPVAFTPSDVEVSPEVDDATEDVEEATLVPVQPTPVEENVLVPEIPKSSSVVPDVEVPAPKELVEVPAPKELVEVPAPAIEEQSVRKTESVTESTESVTKSTEDLPKKISYASMAAKEADKFAAQVAVNKVVIVAPSSSHYSDLEKKATNNGSSDNSVVNNKIKDLTNRNKPQGRNTEGKSIYIGDLPTGIKVEEVADIFKSFGSIRKGGVQVRSYEGDGFTFGFVEFESADSATAAIQAHKIPVGPKEVYITGKKTPNQGYGNNNNNGRNGGRGRVPSGSVGGEATYNGRSPSRGGGDVGYQVRPRSGDSGNNNYEGRQYPSSGGGVQNGGYNGGDNFGEGRRGRPQNRNRSGQAQGWVPNKSQNVDATKTVSNNGEAHEAAQPVVNEA